jgi:hypothetical protein
MLGRAKKFLKGVQSGAAYSGTLSLSGFFRQGNKKTSNFAGAATLSLVECLYNQSTSTLDEL